MRDQILPDTAPRAQRTPTRRAYGRAGLLGLQRVAGNRAVTRLIGRVAQRAPDRAGWTNADTQTPADAKSPQAGGWNAGERAVGQIRRIPLEGLSEGNQQEFGHEGEHAKTSESAKGRAIVLIPAGMPRGAKVDVLLHFHGFGYRSGKKAHDPYAGWRQDKVTSTVRDVDQDRIEAQLQAAGATDMIAILPQGVSKSQFGGLVPSTYINDVFKRLDAIGALPATAGTDPTTAGPALLKNRVILSGHSGGGDRIGNLLNAKTDDKAAEVILFEGIHDRGGAVAKWADTHVKRIAKALGKLDPTQTAERQKEISTCPLFRAYYSVGGGYGGAHTALAEKLTKLFTDPSVVNGLGADLEAVRERFQIIPITGAGHETIVRGLGNDPANGPLADAISARKRADRNLRVVDPANPAKGAGKLLPKGTPTWNDPRPQQRRGKTSPPTMPTTTPTTTPTPTPTPTPTKASAVTPEKIMQIAGKHGLGDLHALPAMSIAVRPGDPLRNLADVLRMIGVSSVDIADALFVEVHPEMVDKKILPEQTDLVAEWVALRQKYATAAAAKPTSQPSSTPDQAAPDQAAPDQATPTGVTPAGGKKFGAPEMDPAKRKQAIDTAVREATTERKGVQDQDIIALSNTLVYNKTTVEKWFGDLVPNATFLDVPVRPSTGSSVSGVHKLLDNRLRKAEEQLVKAFPTLTKAQIAKKVGIRDIGGVRQPKKASGGSLPSYHCFGLAIDINADTNPFVGYNKAPAKLAENASAEVIGRAMWFMHGERFDILKMKVPGDAGKLWDIHRGASDALVAYLALADDLAGKKLQDLVAASQKAGDTRNLKEWQERITLDKAMSREYDFFRGKKGPNKGYAERTGYLDLGRELVVALGAAGLAWGGGYTGSGGKKDMMHFDLRDDSLKRLPKGWKPATPAAPK